MLYHPGPNPTVDALIVRIVNGEQQLLLIQRNENSSAYPGKWALPGGFVDTKEKKGEKWIENLESKIEALKREVLEETGLDLTNYQDSEFEMLGVYDSLERDPRNTSVTWIETHVFKVIIDPNEGNEVEGQDDAQEARWYTFSEIKGMGKSEFAFDHWDILGDCGVRD